MRNCQEHYFLCLIHQQQWKENTVIQSQILSSNVWKNVRIKGEKNKNKIVNKTEFLYLHLAGYVSRLSC